MGRLLKHGVRVLLLAGALSVLAAEERARLYTAPDPSASGGMKGTIINPKRPIVQILAMPPDEPRLAYAGNITGKDRRSFLFENLPMAKYDLFVIYENEFYEGLELSFDPDTLTDKDRQSIADIVNASDPFFNKKVLHRIEGTTGRGNFARCVVTQYRDAPGMVKSDDTALEAGKGRRTFKLIWLKDVGVGWQVVQKRDLYPLTVDLKLLKPAHHYSGALSRIRVTNRVKDLGELDLSKDRK